MHSNRGLKVTLLSLLLVLGSFTAIIIPTSIAQSSGEVTTLYFKEISYFDLYNYDLDDTDESESYSLYPGETPMTQMPPTKQIDSVYPPKLFVDNESKRLKDVNNEELILWLTSWTLMLFDDYGLGNLSEFFGDYGGIFNYSDNELELYIDLFMQNPLRIVGSYTLQGNESIEIDENVIFNLFFDKIRLRPRLYDEIEIGLYSINLLTGFPPNLIKNSTVQINHKFRSGPYNFELENISYVLKPGQSLLFSIKLIPSQKPFTDWLIGEGYFPRIRDGLQNWLNNKIDRRANNTNLPTAQNIAILLKDFKQIIEDVNISSDIIGEMIDSAISFKFLYDSVKHPSSVSVPFTIPSETDNTRVFYLQNGFSMNTSKPTNSSDLSEQLTESSKVWNGAALGDRNKIIKDANVNLFIKNPILLNILRKRAISVTLLDGETEIATQTVDIGFSTKNSNAISFNFEDLDYEIFYNHSLGLGISLTKNKLIGRLFRKATLLYGSESYPSSLTVTYSETENINLDISSEPKDAKILPNQEMTFTLKINSKYDDEIDLNTTVDKKGDWAYSVNEDLPISISAGETREIAVTVKSENDKNEAYTHKIDLIFIVSGKTGIDQKSASGEVSEDLIEYDFELYGQENSKNIKKGSSGTFYFIIENKNTGAVDDVDSYTIEAESENGWELKFTDSISSLLIGDKTDTTDIKVIAYVPKNTTYDSDIIKVTVFSDSNPEVSKSLNVTVNVKETTFFESIYNIFDKVANSIGLDDVFGSNAPYALAGIIILLIIIIISIIILIIKRKLVKIICTDRIKEIDPNEEAIFDITIQNPTRKIKTYDIHSNVNPLSQNWQIATDVDKITIAPRKSKQIILVVKPNKFVEPNEWTEAKLLVNVAGKKKIKDITTMIMVKDGKAILQIKDVFNWPKVFKKDDRVTTSFKLENKGNITARDVKVLLFINSKQKNKVEVTVPHGAYADIKIPWIAQKGKNDLQLKIVE